MEVKSQFDEFLKAIRPTDTQVEALKKGHELLRARLWADKDLQPLLVSDFLQGSYRRYTAVKPKNGKRADVDIVVVTNLDEQQYTPAQAMKKFEPFLNKHYEGKWRPQGRSFGIEMSAVDLDVVVTSAPSAVAREAVLQKSVREDVLLGEYFSTYVLEKSAGRSAEPAWKSAPLRIPDRDAKCWDDTDPLAQIRATWDKSKRTDGHYVNVVKAIKWWRRLNSEPNHPKGYPVEHLVYLCCPDGIESVAEGVAETFQRIADAYSGYADANTVPFVPDHGVPSHNVLGRVSPADFKAFIGLVRTAAAQARAALLAPTVKESCEKWRELFGGEFPPPPSQDRGGPDGGSGPKQGGFTPPAAPYSPRTERFA